MLWVIQYFSPAIQWLCTICLSREKYLAVWWMSGGSIQQAVVQMKARMSNACKREPFSFRPFGALCLHQNHSSVETRLLFRGSELPSMQGDHMADWHNINVRLHWHANFSALIIPYHFELCHLVSCQCHDILFQVTGCCVNTFSSHRIFNIFRIFMSFNFLHSILYFPFYTNSFSAFFRLYFSVCLVSCRSI